MWGGCGCVKIAKPDLYKNFLSRIHLIDLTMIFLKRESLVLQYGYQYEHR